MMRSIARMLKLVQVEVVGLGEEVFKQLIGSIRVEGSYADGHFQLKSFKFDPWGFYYSAESQGKVYFAAYDHYEMGMHPMSYYDVLYEKSEDRNLSKYGLLTDILIDDNTESSINPEIPLKLKEGYELTIKPIDYRVSFELKKNGQTVDSKLESSLLDTSTAKATLMDKTYAYSKDLGEAKKIVTIAVHLKDRNTVDGIFQLSENPISVLSISRELI